MSYQEIEARHYWKYNYRIVIEVIILDATAEDEEFLADIFGDYYILRINFLTDFKIGHFHSSIFENQRAKIISLKFSANLSLFFANSQIFPQNVF